MAAKARVIAPSGSKRVTGIMADLLVEMKKEVGDPIFQWSTALGLNPLDFQAGNWSKYGRLHPRMKLEVERMKEQAWRWKNGLDLDSYPRKLRTERRKAWHRREPRPYAVGVDELAMAYTQAAYFFSELLDMLDNKVLDKPKIFW